MSQDAAVEKERLELIFGAMSGGKSSELMRRLRRKCIYKKILAVNTVKDVRYGNEGIITHDGNVLPAVRVSLLRDLLNLPEYHQAEVIGIDEANFYPDVDEFIIAELENTNKTFIIAALNGDKNKNLFGKVHLLLPHAERIDFYPALCRRCGDGTNAAFTVALVKFDGQEKVGGAELYEAVCRYHHDLLN
jgi:thymidine kinase